MDGQLAAPTDQELEALTDQFVKVRLIQMGGVDLSIFQFDPFLSWSVFFMNGDTTIYGRFGRANPLTKRAEKDSNPNHTLEGLRAALAKALETHAGYTKEPDAWTAALGGKTGPEPRWRFAEATPAAKKYGRMKRTEGGAEGCVHCHEVQRVTIDSMFMESLELPDNMLWVYPRVHVLGLTMDNRHCARVTGVAPGSIAAKAGVQAGDDLLTLAGQPLGSIADIQWVLHNFPDEGGALPVEVERTDGTHALTMKLDAGWRRTEDFGWRYRVAGYAAWLWAGVSFEDTPDGVRVANRSPNWFKKPNRDARRALERGDVIVEVDGRSGFDRSGLLAYLMREKRLGSTVKLTVLRDGRRQSVSFQVPSEQPEVLGH